MKPKNNEMETITPSSQTTPILLPVEVPNGYYMETTWQISRHSVYHPLGNDHPIPSPPVAFTLHEVSQLFLVENASLEDVTKMNLMQRFPSASPPNFKLPQPPTNEANKVRAKMEESYSNTDATPNKAGVHSASIKVLHKSQPQALPPPNTNSLQSTKGKEIGSISATRPSQPVTSKTRPRLLPPLWKGQRVKDLKLKRAGAFPPAPPQAPARRAAHPGIPAGRGVLDDGKSPVRQSSMDAVHTKRKREQKDPANRTKVRRTSYDDTLEIRRDRRSWSVASSVPEAGRLFDEVLRTTAPIPGGQVPSKIDIIGWKNEIIRVGYLNSQGKLDANDEEKLQRVLLKIEGAIVTKRLLRENLGFVDAIKKIVEDEDFRGKILDKAEQILQLWNISGFL
ncbi:hypothetical protein DXG01_008004 [Tephrocybe rancida]|nr:hypothetical protein DXG01_008004 [Tephrocybe rancida]